MENVLYYYSCIIVISCKNVWISSYCSINDIISKVWVVLVKNEMLDVVNENYIWMKYLVCGIEWFFELK